MFNADWKVRITCITKHDRDERRNLPLLLRITSHHITHFTSVSLIPELAYCDTLSTV